MIRFKSNPVRADKMPGLLTAHGFRMALKVERARSDRTGSAFSLVVIGAGANPGGTTILPGSERLLEQAGRVALERVRCTDVVGWHEEGGLGIILPHSDAKSAWALVDDILEELHTGFNCRVGKDACEVYCYPQISEGAAT